MRKKLCSILLSVATAVSLCLPVTAQAAGSGPQGVTDTTWSSATFFQWMANNSSLSSDVRQDAQQAYAILHGNCPASLQADEVVSYSAQMRLVDLSDDDSPFSLLNLSDTIDYIDYANKLRTSDAGVDKLDVSPTLMAMAELDVNYNYKTRDLMHPVTFDVGENLIGGRPSPESAFNAWYWTEKQNYASDPTWNNDTGHYLNIANGSYGTTGFASCYAGMYGSTMGQTFAFPGEFASVSADQFRSLLNEFFGTFDIMYRLYNPSSGEHLFTKDQNEVMTLTSRYYWNYEGVAWYAPKKSSKQVYRLFNPSSGEHLYTMDANERRTLAAAPNNWRDEGIAWYSDGSVSLVRLYNAKASGFKHHYSGDSNEINTLTARNGWKNEGIAWYGLAK